MERRLATVSDARSGAGVTFALVTWLEKAAIGSRGAASSMGKLGLLLASTILPLLLRLRLPRRNGHAVGQRLLGAGQGGRRHLPLHALGRC